MSEEINTIHFSAYLKAFCAYGFESMATKLLLLLLLLSSSSSSSSSSSLLLSSSSSLLLSSNFSLLSFSWEIFAFPGM
jgi:hypothetical protein